MNVLINELPTEWNGYKVNTSFRIGLQISILIYDKDIPDYEKNIIIEELLFSDPKLDENGNEVYDDDVLVTEMRKHPDGEDYKECFNWFMNGWAQEKGKAAEQRTVDYNKDQWRIYADFRQIYHINLNEVDMHWWEFMGLLWNMPYKLSSFLTVKNVREKKVTSKMSSEERNSIKEAQKIYAIEQPEKVKKLNSEEQGNYDSFWEFRNQSKK